MQPRTRYHGPAWLAAVVLGALGAAVLVGIPAVADPAADEAAMRQSVAATLVAQRGEQARAAYGPAAAGGDLATMVEPKRYSKDRRWVFGGSVIRMPDSTEGSPVTALFLAHRVGRQWTVALEGTESFAAAAIRAPVVSAAERALFVRASQAAAKGVTSTAAGTPTGLALPWRQGQGWAHWGVHGNGGNTRPYNAIDFYGGDGQVRASRAGLMYRFCTSARWHFIKVVHDNGYTTGYYHLVNVTTKGDGASVALGEYIGEIDVQLPCGGRANGDHVHWTLWRGDSGVTVQGKDIGGWTWFEGASAYTGYAERGSTRIFRNTCCPLVNHGGGGDPSPHPTGTVNTGDFDTVNLRSGPGLSFSVVGQASDGDVVEIVCTARGDFVTGPWDNRTDVWDRMPSGNWISDAFVDTGSNEPVAPPC